VATVVAKLFAIVLPTVAAFGQKDAQQAAVIRRMVRDLMLDVEVLVLPTVRDGDGLALSSRNAYLTEEERHVALAIPRALEAARAAVQGGEQRAEAIVRAAREVLGTEPELVLDYLELVDPDDLGAVSQLEHEALLLVAARVGATRLIDNTQLRP
jgi:pantoate--beta-alanine ligase